MQNADLISVIIPVYNVERFLSRCIDSVINQTYKNLEIILVDDGSTDNSGKICDEYMLKDNRIKVIHKQNAGVSVARNVGLDIAKGDYIGFVDSDDFISPDMYEFLYVLLKKNKVAVSCCNRFDFYCDKAHENLNFYNNGIYTLNEIIQNVYIGLPVWNKLFNRNSINNIQFNEKLIYGEDLFFCFEVLQKNKMVCNKDAKYYYYYNNQGVTKIKQFRKEYLENINTDEIILQYLQKNNFKLAYKKYIKACLFQKVDFLSWIALGEKINKEDVRVIIKYIKYKLAKNYLITIFFPIYFCFNYNLKQIFFIFLCFINLNLASKIYKLIKE